MSGKDVTKVQGSHSPVLQQHLQKDAKEEMLPLVKEQLKNCSPVLWI